jgi:hypothetical protein
MTGLILNKSKKLEELMKQILKEIGPLFCSLISIIFLIYLSINLSLSLYIYIYFAQLWRGAMAI